MLALGALALTLPAAAGARKYTKDELGQNYTDAPVTCDHPPLSARLATHDPTSFSDDPGVVLAPYRKVVFTKLEVTLRRDGRLLASEKLDRLSTSGTILRLRDPDGGAVSVTTGDTTLTVVGTRNACANKTQKVTRQWDFTQPSLPVRAAPATTFVEDARRGLRVYLRSVGGRTSSGVTVRLVDPDGRTVSRAPAGTVVTSGAVVDLAGSAKLKAGSYRLVLGGRVAGANHTSTYALPLVLGSRGTAGSPPVDADAGLAEQHVVVDWSDSRPKGRDQAGFVAPGIGYGELVCGNQQQHIRFHPTDLGRETSMMLWTYKDWRENNEKSIRESIHTQFGGPDFQEGLNKFSPPEKHMTGEYEGLLTDRGVQETPFADGLAPPTSIKLTWSWDFSDPRKARCHVEAVLRTENGNLGAAAKPLARSLQVVWRGEESAPGHDRAETDVPGLGPVGLVCEATPGGTRAITIGAPQGATILVREGGDDKKIETDTGPVVVPLPNNGQLKLTFFGGASMLVSSRWKVNDPRPAENACRVALQAVVE
jgi:hypothetical protein